MSVAVAVGVIALAGLAVEIAVLMLVYLNQARATLKVHDGDEALQGAIVAAASQRLRPILHDHGHGGAGPVAHYAGRRSWLADNAAHCCTHDRRHALSAGIGLNRCAHGISATLSPPAARPLSDESHYRPAHYPHLWSIDLMTAKPIPLDPDPLGAYRNIPRLCGERAGLSLRPCCH